MPDHPTHTPAEAEAELVRRYKQQRPLQRPPTHAGHLVAYLAAVECGVAAVAMAARAGLAARGIACSFTAGEKPVQAYMLQRLCITKNTHRRRSPCFRGNEYRLVCQETVARLAKYSEGCLQAFAYNCRKPEMQRTGNQACRIRTFRQVVT